MQKGWFCFYFLFPPPPVFFSFFAVFGKCWDKGKPVAEFRVPLFPASTGNVIKPLALTSFQMGINPREGRGRECQVLSGQVRPAVGTTLIVTGDNTALTSSISCWKILTPNYQARGASYTLITGEVRVTKKDAFSKHPSSKKGSSACSK